MNRNEKYKQRDRKVDLGTMVYGKVPPQAKEIEQAILGAIMVQRDAYDTVAANLKPECFYVDAHQKVYQAIQRLSGKSQPIDVLTVEEELRAAGELDNVGGSYYITQLTNSVVSAAHIESHSRIVIQKYIQREIIRISGELIADAYEDGADALEMLDRAESELASVTQTLSFSDMVAVEKVLVDTIRHIEQNRALYEQNGGIGITGVPSGFKELDGATRGWQPGDLIILAARPSVGKTAFALSLARNAAKYLADNGGGSVAFWSLEMKNSRLMMRMLAAEAEIWLTKMQTGKMSKADMEQLYKNGIKTIARLGIFFDEQPGLTMQKLKAKARKLKRKNKLKIIFIDYLQLMTPEGRTGNREQEISSISRGLKLLAQELEVPIVALSQLSREIEKRTNNKPQLSDLRESGAIEQDADLVMFLYGASEAQKEQAKTDGNILEVMNRKYATIAKQRDGMLVTVELNFKGDFQKFEEAANLAPEPYGSSWRPVTKEEKEGDPF